MDFNASRSIKNKKPKKTIDLNNITVFGRLQKNVNKKQDI